MSCGSSASSARRPTWRPPPRRFRWPSWPGGAAIRIVCSASTVQPGAAHGARGAVHSGRAPGRCGRPRSRLVAGPGQDGDRGPRPARLRRQPPPVSLPVRLGAADGAHGMEAADIDSCMRLGAGYPMGPLRLLDYIGLDVAAAIGQSLFADTEEEPLPRSRHARGDDRRRQARPQERHGLLRVRLRAQAAVRRCLPARSQITSASEMP